MGLSEWGYKYGNYCHEYLQPPPPPPIKVLTTLALLAKCPDSPSILQGLRV